MSTLPTTIVEPPLLEAGEVYKAFSGHVALSGVSLRLYKGDILGLLGANGAGKTTFMRMLSGYLIPDAGTITIHQQALHSHLHVVQQSIGYVPEGAPLYPDMTPQEFLLFAGRLRGLKRAYLQTRMDYVAEHLHLQSVWQRPIESLSKGFRRRVAVAQALLHEPAVLILDEPTDGLDPLQKKELYALLKAISKECGIIISTHILEEVKILCNKVTVIHHGKILAAGKPDMLVQDAKKVDFSEWFHALIAAHHTTNSDVQMGS